MILFPGGHDNIFEVAAEVLLKPRPYRKRHPESGVTFSVAGLELDHLRNMVVVAMVLVIGIFVMDPEADQHRYGHTCGQAADIDEGRSPVPEEVAPGNDQIVLEHVVVLPNR